MTFIDTNIIIDILDDDPTWRDWSMAQLTEAAADGASINVIVVAELSRNFGQVGELRRTVERLSLELEPLDEASAFIAGKRFQEYRRARTAEEGARVLPDFLIGAHALGMGARLLTRDPRLYRSYFPDLQLITPETHP